MPNRIIKESFLTSESIDKLSPRAESLFIRLLLSVDDFGCYHGNPVIIKSNCFPLKSDDIKSDQVKSWLDELISNEIIRPYTDKETGKPYIQFINWKKHQNTRAQKPKYPLPDDECEQMKSAESNCEQMKSDAPDIRNSIFDIRNSHSNSKTTQSKDDGFEEWWDLYPKKSGDIRLAYQEYLFALDDVSAEELYKSLKAQVENLPEEDLKYFPSADKWLRNRTWRKKVVPKQGKPRAFTPTEF